MTPSISGHTALAGVLGNPVHHSLSPAMHNAALAELGLDWVYLAMPAAADQLEAVLRGLEAVDCRGLNVKRAFFCEVPSYYAKRRSATRIPYFVNAQRFKTACRTRFS